DESGLEVTLSRELTSIRRRLFLSLMNTRRRLVSIMRAGQDHRHGAAMSFHQVIFFIRNPGVEGLR
ncbi:MAG TPA: hypothetical protein VF748_17800, partial [Candidatus Acidoferrum sp.]